MPSSRLSVLIIPITVFFTFGIGIADENLDTDQQIIEDKTYELFTRAKVNDKAVMYENEFPYLREERDLEDYLNNRFVKAYNADTLIALQVDSVHVNGDTAQAYIRLEYLQKDSTIQITKQTLTWRKYDDVWIKPSLSLLEDQQEFEEELRIYWDAVKEMEQQDSDENSPKDGS